MRKLDTCFLTSFGSLVGHDFFEQETFKAYWLTYVMYGLQVMMYIGTAYTIYFYDLAEKLNVIAFVGIAFQVTFQLIFKN